MKKTFSFLLVLIFVFLLSSCGQKESTIPELRDDSTVRVGMGETETFKESTTETTTEVPSVPIEWTNKSYEWEDTDGYKYEISYKLSPWILLSNTEIVNSAWNEISNGKVLPDFDDWGLKKESTGSHFRNSIPKGSIDTYFAFHMTDMYYCVGTISIKNLTDGFDIDENNTRSIYEKLAWQSAFEKPDYAGTYCIGRVFYSSKTSDESDGPRLRTSMHKNSLGPVCFVIMAPENFSPNHPDGEYYNYMNSGVFTNGHDLDFLRIGVIGKDGKYVAPEITATD